MKSRYRSLGITLIVFLLSGPAHAATVDLIEIDNQIINPITAEYITSAIDQAESENAACLIIQLDTPGGLLESTRTIVKRMLAARVPLVVYVSPNGARAGSAGVFITLASHVAAMAPTTNIGAAHPVGGSGSGGPIKKLIRQVGSRKNEKDGGTNAPAKKRLFGVPIPGTTGDAQELTEEITTSPMDEKVLHDTLAWVEGIARARGRNVEWSRLSVENSASITAEEALKLHVIDLISDDLGTLLNQLDGRVVQLPATEVTLDTARAHVRTRTMTRRQRILLVITNPTVAYLLMMCGFWGLITEVTHPGLGFPGIAGVICLILALLAMQTLPINYAGVALMALGIGLLAAEIMVTSFGLLALGGAVCLTLGSLILIDSPLEFMQVSLQVILPIVLTTTGIALLLVGAVVKSHRRKVTTGAKGLLGAIGEARTDIDLRGQIFIHGELWSAVATTRISRGQQVRVTAIDRLTVTVEPLT